MESFTDFSANADAHVFNVLYESEDVPMDEILEHVAMLTEKSATAPMSPQVWGSLKCDPKKAADGCEGEIKKMYDGIFKIAKEAESKLSRGLKKAASKAKNAKVLVDIKKVDSFADKIMNRGKKIEDITDVLRAAILLPTPEDVELVVKAIKKDFVVSEFEYKGKKEVVKQTFKGNTKQTVQTQTKGGDSEYGYHGSYHFLVKIDGMHTEIQVMTKRLWAYKNVAHEIYNDLRSSKGTVDAKIADVKKQLSKQVFNSGNKENKFLKARKVGSKRKG